MDNKALMKLSYGLYVLGALDGGKRVGCIVDAVIQSTHTPAGIVLSSMWANRTNEVIHETGTFTLSVLPKNVAPFYIANFGFQSSRDVDKWANCPAEESEGLPVLRDCAAYLRCRVEQTIELTTHTIFLATVEDAWLGGGEPLIYGDYQNRLKTETMQAFQRYKNGGEKPASVLADSDRNTAEPVQKTAPEKKTVWRCTVCSHEYDGKIPFEELPEEYCCPLCKQPKSAFVRVDE